MLVGGSAGVDCNTETFMPGHHFKRGFMAVAVVVLSAIGQREGGARFLPGFLPHARAETQVSRQVSVGFRQVSARFPPGFRQVSRQVSRQVPRQISRQVSHQVSRRVSRRVSAWWHAWWPARWPARFPAPQHQAGTQAAPACHGVTSAGWCTVTESTLLMLS